MAAAEQDLYLIRRRREAAAGLLDEDSLHPATGPALRDVLADVGWLLEHIEEVQAAYELMAVQFRIMQQEKEHGWREAERIEAERDVLRAQRQAVLDLCDKHEHGALRWQDPLPVPEWIPLVRAALGSC